MAEPPVRDALQLRVSSAIVEAAARVLAARGETASVADVAAEAGVARATVYRYFGSRGALTEEVVRAGLERAGGELQAARVAEVGAVEGVTRAVRALLEVGDSLSVMVRRRAAAPLDEFDEVVIGPLRRLFHAGQRSAEIRDDVPARWLAESLVSLAANALSSPPAAGREDTVAAVSSAFLDGARGTGRRPAAESLPSPGSGSTPAPPTGGDHG